MIKLNFSNTLFNICFFIILLSIVFFREPCWFVDGSFKSVDYRYYNQILKEKNFFEIIFHIREGHGALIFWNNITHSFLRFFSYDLAKYLISYTNLFVYMMIFSYVYFSQSQLFIDLKHKIFAVFVILLSPPMIPEVWMSSAHVRGYFGIFSLILLFQDHKKQNVFFNNLTVFLIFFSGLCSIYAAALTPAYLFKYYLIRDKENLKRFIFAFFSFLVQAVIVLNHINEDLGETTRFGYEIKLFLESFYSYFYNIPIRSFFGSTIPKFLFFNLELYQMKYFEFLVYFLLIIFILYLLSNVLKKKDNLSYILIISFILITLLILLGTVNPGFVGGRYAVLPGVILIFIIFRFYLIEENPFFKNLFFLMLAFSLIIGLIEFKYFTPTPEALKCTTSWSY